MAIRVKERMQFYAVTKSAEQRTGLMEAVAQQVHHIDKRALSAFVAKQEGKKSICGGQGQ